MINRAQRITGISLSAPKIYQKEDRALLLGLDGSGKTNLLYKLKLGEVISSIPTIGFNVETIDRNVTMWDVGGQPKLRPLWRHYFQATTTIVWAVDSSDPSRFQESAEELRKLFVDGSDELSESRLVVVATKQDLPFALHPADVWAAMTSLEPALGSCITNRLFFVIGFSIHGNPDLEEVYDAIQGIGKNQAADAAASRRRRVEFEQDRHSHRESLPSILSRYMHSQLEYAQQRCTAKNVDDGHEDEDRLAISLSGVTFSMDLFSHVLSYLDVTDLMPSFEAVHSCCDAAGITEMDECARDGAVVFVSRSMSWCALDVAAKTILRSIFSFKSAQHFAPENTKFLLDINKRLRSTMYLSLPPVLRRVHARLCTVLLYKMLVANDKQELLFELLRPGGEIGSMFPNIGRGEDVAVASPYDVVLPLVAFLCYADEVKLSFRLDDKTFVEAMMRQLNEMRGNDPFTVMYLPIIQRFQIAARDGMALVLENDADEARPVLDTVALKGIELQTETIERALVLAPSLKGDIMRDLVRCGSFCKLIVCDEPFLNISFETMMIVAKVMTGEIASYCTEFEFTFLKSISAVLPMLKHAIARAAPRVVRVVVTAPAATAQWDNLGKHCASRFPKAVVTAGRTIDFSQ